MDLGFSLPILFSSRKYAIPERFGHKLATKLATNVGRKDMAGEVTKRV